jgi:hypothetical protein
MLAIAVKGGEPAFVYHNGFPIGAVLVGDNTRHRQSPMTFTLLFGGTRSEFEILRAGVVVKRFGPEELERLRKRFLGE